MRPPNKTRTLIVDDHEMVRRGIESVLMREGLFEVCGEAENGVDAIHKVQELRPDLVILDVSMPVMGGLEAIHHIRRSSPDVKIVIVTIHNSKQIEHEAKAHGADAFVTKSEVSATLVRALKDVLAAN